MQSTDVHSPAPFLIPATRVHVAVPSAPAVCGLSSQKYLASFRIAAAAQRRRCIHCSLRAIRIYAAYVKNKNNAVGIAYRLHHTLFTPIVFGLCAIASRTMD
jgi:hypothetical protein